MSKYNEVDNGYFNTIIEGYLIDAMRRSGFTADDIIKAQYGLQEALSVTDAKKAETIAKTPISH